MNDEMRSGINKAIDSAFTEKVISLFLNLTENMSLTNDSDEECYSRFQKGLKTSVRAYELVLKELNDSESEEPKGNKFKKIKK